MQGNAYKGRAGRAEVQQIIITGPADTEFPVPGGAFNIWTSFGNQITNYKKGYKKPRYK